MTRVPLRTYLRDIEDAIEKNQIDEAVAHCRHILQAFPKHTDTYRLLGKAYLESQKYGSAADIFQRVLSAIPDDFVSHIGMSIIREDEGNVDTALWHMERAFEVQPYNPAIQGEVRRLYGKRDGMEPAKARLTRGALARMYAKGGRYDQAIAELRATLANEPDRSDLQIILAEMYAQSGEYVKAIETSSTILRNLPNCLQANRLLAQLLKGTEREEESKTCQQRLVALDPYEAHVSPHAPTAQDVPEQAVTIARLSWTAAMRTTGPSEQPEWASSLGVVVEQPASARGDLPDWLASASEDSPVPIGDDITPSAAGDDEIPEWMKDSGWQPASGEIVEGPSPFALEDVSDAEADLDSAVAADLPDWIKGMAPAATVAAAELAGEDKVDLDALFDAAPKPDQGDAPDWSKGFDEEVSPGFTPSAADQEDELPDWMRAVAEHAETEPTLVQAASDLPDWLRADDASPIPATDEAESTGVTDFLIRMGRDQSTRESQIIEAEPLAEDEFPNWLKAAEAPAEPVTEPQPEGSGAPDWMKSLEEEELEPQPILAAEPAPQTGVIADDIPDWLKSLEAAEQKAEAEEIPLEAATKEPAIPDWLDELAEATLVEEASEAPEPATEPQMAVTPDWLAEISAEAPVLEQEKEFPEWLTSPDAFEREEVPTRVEEPVAEMPPEEAAFPEWLTPPREEKPVAAEGAPAAEFEDADAAMAWLEGLAAKRGVSEDELITRPEERLTAPPSWVQEAMQKPEVESEAEAIPEDFPDWLRDSAFAQVETEAEVVQPEEAAIEPEPVPAAQWLAGAEELEEEKSDEIPDWLRSMGVEAEPIEPSIEEPVAKSDALPAWLEDVGADGAEPEAPEEPTWIREFGKEAPTFEQVQEQELVAGEAQPAEAEALPDWLQDYGAEKDLPDWTRAEAKPTVAKEDEYTWRPSEAELPIGAEAPAQEKLDLNQASLVELERLPGMGFRRAQAIFSHRQAHGPFYKLDDLLFLGIEAETIEGIKGLVEVRPLAEVEDRPGPRVEPVFGPAVSVPAISPEEAEDEHHAILIGAQSKLSQGDLSGALANYDQLIKKGKRVDQVIADLEATDQARPDDPEILQALGDAYMRADRLQEALDTYSRIEKLLL